MLKDLLWKYYNYNFILCTQGTHFTCTVQLKNSNVVLFQKSDLIFNLLIEEVKKEMDIVTRGQLKRS